MNIFAFTSLVFSFVIFSIGLTALSNNPNRKLNRVFFLFAVSVFYWSFIEFGFRQAESIETARFWLQAGFLWAFSIPLELHFIYLFAKNEKVLKRKVTYALLYVPAIAAALFTLIEPSATEPLKVSWGWTYGRPEGILFTILYVWIIGIALFTQYTIIRIYRREMEKTRKRQALFILIGVTVTTLVGLMVIISSNWELGIPEFTSVGFMIECGLIFYAMQEFELFKSAPTNATESILSTLTDAVILTSFGGTIDAVNRAALTMLEYKEVELIDQPIGKIIGQVWKGDMLPGEDDYGIEMAFIAKGGRRFPVSLSTSDVPDEEGNPQGIVFVGRDLSKRKSAEEQLIIANKEKAVLLQEIHHRVKNNLQVVSSLLSMQTENIEDERALRALNESRDRVFSMAVVHELLYQAENLQDIDFETYTKSLVEYIFEANKINKKKIVLKVDISGIELDIDTVIQCGLIITELVSNSLFHAFPGDREGEIYVGMAAGENEKFMLIVIMGLGCLQSLSLRRAIHWAYSLLTCYLIKWRGS